MKSLISIIGDSSCMPRDRAEIERKDLFWVKMQHECFDIHPFIQKSITTEIHNVAKYYAIEYVNPDVLIIWLGIVDASPRPIKKSTKIFLEFIFFLNNKFLTKFANFFIKYLSKNRYKLTKKKKATEVSKQDFYNNYSKILESAKSSNPNIKILLINIIYPGPFMIEKNFGILENIIEYNKIIQELAIKYNAEIIDTFEFGKNNPDSILPDGNHFNKIGHNFVFNEMIKKITN